MQFIVAHQHPHPQLYSLINLVAETIANNIEKDECFRLEAEVNVHVWI